MPRLTVMMPAYNAEGPIERAVRSTLASMPSDAELFVWDDASSDGTVSVLERIEDPRLRVHADRSNRGSGRVRASILEATDSEYVANMDADDVCMPWRFARQLRALRDTDLSFAAVVHFRDGRPRRSPVPHPLSGAESPLALLIENPFAQSTLAASRAAIERLGGWADMRRGQDYELWLRAAAAGVTLRLGPLPVVAYRLSGTQISQSEGYRTAVREAPEIRRAYQALLDSTLGADVTGLDSAARRRRAAERMSLAMRPPIAALYRTKLRRRGLFGDAWLP